MKLTLNETKTRIVNAKEENFSFLGYELGPLMKANYFAYGSPQGTS